VSRFTYYLVNQKLPYDKPTHLAQNDEPWRRLHNTNTQASSHRNVFHNDASVSLLNLEGGFEF